MRAPYHPVAGPPSRLAIWARRIALFSLLAALLAIVIVRARFLDIEPAIATFGGALLLGWLAILLAFASFIVIWREGAAGLSYGLTAIAIGLALNAYPLYLGYKWYKLPAIADITTDPLDPPLFNAIAQLRTRAANPAAYAGLYAAEQQRAAYPEVESLRLSAPPAAVYDAAVKIVDKRRWRILDKREPQPPRREGRIEAVALTPIMGFPEDVIVRVRSDGEGTRLDVRSASRYGQHDFGDNAARIRRLMDDIESVAEAAAKEKKPPPNPPATKPGQPAKR